RPAARRTSLVPSSRAAFGTARGPGLVVYPSVTGPGQGNPEADAPRMGDMNRLETVKRQPGPGPDGGEDRDLAGLLPDVGRGDHRAFDRVSGRLAGPVYGVARRILRDPAQSEEVAQEALLEIWRTASRFDPAKGSPAAWAMTIAHRRAVDRVRSEN